jgi:hypothetical protein
MWLNPSVGGSLQNLAKAPRRVCHPDATPFEDAAYVGFECPVIEVAHPRTTARTAPYGKAHQQQT